MNRREPILKVLSLFSGIGAFERALENIGIRYELVNYCEVDKFAAKAYSILHHVPQEKNLGDITQVDETELPEDIDLITYGFPCQDISIAGEKKGFIDKNGQKTRSGLFFDALRIIQATKPRIAVAENVKNLTGTKMKSVFDTVLNGLDEAGYNTYWQIMNCADYEIPQHRERVLMVSIRKDIDDGSFRFPKPVPLATCLNDFLLKNAPEKYYLSADRIKNVIRHNDKHSGQMCDRGGLCETLLARDHKDPKVVTG